MRQFIGFFLVLFSVALVLAACSGGAAPADPGNAKPVVIQISSVPDPALVGDVAFTLLITDKDGDPLEGARVDIGVDHTDMTGMSMSGPANRTRRWAVCHQRQLQHER